MGRVCRSIVAIAASLAFGLFAQTPGYAQATGTNQAFGDQFGGYGGAVAAPTTSNIPPGVDVFNLTLDEVIKYSLIKNFEVVGHSYFKGPWLTAFAQKHGIGASFNTPRVYNGIAYLAGYNSPPVLFGVLIADVHDPKDMKPLSFIPCYPGTRCPYIRVNPERHILVVGEDQNGANPDKASGPVKAGFAFYDVSDPSHPKQLGFLETRPNGHTHGLEIDNDYAYGCATVPASKPGPFDHEVVIVNYADPENPRLVSTYHVQGQHVGEQYAGQDQLNPDGTAQQIWCHEITTDKDRLYVAYRDAGLLILDVTNPADPVLLSRLDYVPPFNGGSIGAAHTFQPIITDPTQYPTLAVAVDEIFDCPPGFGRVVDISDLSNPQFMSSYRIPGVSDHYDYATHKFVCPPGDLTAHMPMIDINDPSILFNAWYTEGERVFDLSNPFLPREIGYYISPPYICGPYTSSCGASDNQAKDTLPVLRQTREEWQDPDTGLLYVTDGNGGGLTVLRWTGPMPPPPIPGAR